MIPVPQSCRKIFCATQEVFYSTYLSGINAGLHMMLTMQVSRGWGIAVSQVDFSGNLGDIKHE